MSNSSTHWKWNFPAKQICHSPAIRILEACISGLLSYRSIFKIFTFLSQNKVLLIFDGKIETLINFSWTLWSAERFLGFGDGWGVRNQIKQDF